MRIFRNIIQVLLFICIVPFIFAGCGAVETEVPDSLIQDLVKDNEYSDLGECEWSVIHHVDEETHRDTVDVILGIYAPYAEITSECSAVYEYDRSSDLWTLINYDGWSEPDYNFAFNDSLVKTWNIEEYGNAYEITVTDVYPTQISLEFSLKESIYAGLDGQFTWKVSGYGTYDINNGYVEIPLELPDECYVSWKDTQSGENETVTYLNIKISPESGFVSAYINPTIQVW